MRREHDPIPYAYPFSLNAWPLRARVAEYWSYLALDPSHGPMAREFARVTACDYEDKTGDPDDGG